ncbi:MAG: rhamnulokinase [Spirochaetales bacterium]|jgi:rhamnulokinase|nr:rhamnulokinase [Spirochaetales bacterium]
MSKYVAVDLGAESGRVIAGDVSSMEVFHRFSNGPVRIGNSIYWNFLNIFSEIKIGLTKAFEKYGNDIVSIGIDTWGVDYALLDQDGDLIGNPYHYRDDRTDGVPEELFKSLPLEEIYRESGVQVMQLNTIYQLYAFAKNKPSLLACASAILTVPALLNYWLTGERKNEYTHVTTTQLYNPKTRSWSESLIKGIGVDPAIFGEIVKPGTKIGTLLPHVAKEIGAPESVCVIASASHDTASAVAAVPAPGEKGYAYLSSGTWSLLGIESPNPIISEKSRLYNFTNEGAADGGFRFLKNIMGLWIMQECKHYWDDNGANDSYDDLTDMAEESGAGVFKMDVDDDRFLKPSLIDDTMPDRIRTYASETGQQIPESKGQIVRGILEGLAEKYAENIRRVEDVTEKKISKLHIVGGGSMNIFLCKLAASAAGIPVLAGPKEATAIGNIMVQEIAMGELGSFDEGRQLVLDSYKITEYLP